MPNDDIGHDRDPPRKGPEEPEIGTTGTQSADADAGDPEPARRKRSPDDVQS